MKISTKGRYALRLLIDLALNQQDGYVALKDAAKRQNVSKKYLEQIVPILNKAGLLKTTRGFQGGYMLAKAPNEITVGDVLKATESSLAPVACGDCTKNVCEKADTCLAMPVWAGLYNTISEYLDSVTIQDVIDGKMKNK